MELHRIIVHLLNKEVSKTGASTELSDLLMDLNDRSKDLVRKLDDSYRRKRITYAIFNEEEGRVFPDEFKSFSNDLNDRSFVEFSRNSVMNLRNMIENIAPAKGGYLVFAHYSVNAEAYTSVFLIRNTQGMLFKRDSENRTFIIDPQIHLDLDRLAMACRIKFDKYYSREGKYLSFIKHRMSDISEYFINWIAAIETKNNKIMTKDLYNLVNSLKLPEDDQGKELDIGEFRQKIYDYVKSQPAKQVDLLNLSEHFYNDEKYIADSLETLGYEIDTEFIADNSALKRFIRINVESDGILMRFDRSQLNSKVRIDDDNRNVVIIESEKFAKDLRDEIDIE